MPRRPDRSPLASALRYGPLTRRFRARQYARNEVAAGPDALARHIACQLNLAPAGEVSRAGRQIDGLALIFALCPQVQGLGRIAGQGSAHAVHVQHGVGLGIQWPAHPQIQARQGTGQVCAQLPAPQRYQTLCPLASQRQIHPRPPVGLLEIQLGDGQAGGQGAGQTLQHGLQRSGIQHGCVDAQVTSVIAQRKARPRMGQRAGSGDAVLPAHLRREAQGVAKVTRSSGAQGRARGRNLGHESAGHEFLAYGFRQEGQGRGEVGAEGAANGGQHGHAACHGAGRQGQQLRAAAFQTELAGRASSRSAQHVAQIRRAAPVAAQKGQAADVGPRSGQRGGEGEDLRRNADPRLRGAEGLGIQAHRTAQIRHTPGGIGAQIRPVYPYVQVGDCGGQGQFAAGDDALTHEFTHRTYPAPSGSQAEGASVDGAAQHVVPGIQVAVELLPTQSQAACLHIQIRESAQGDAGAAACSVEHAHGAARLGAGAGHVAVYIKATCRRAARDGAAQIHVVPARRQRGRTGGPQTLAIGQAHVQAVPGATERHRILVEDAAGFHSSPEGLVGAARPPGGAALYGSGLTEGRQGLPSGHAGKAGAGVVGHVQVAPGARCRQVGGHASGQVQCLRGNGHAAERQRPGAPGQAGFQVAVVACQSGVQRLRRIGAVSVGPAAADLHIRKDPARQSRGHIRIGHIQVGGDGLPRLLPVAPQGPRYACARCRSIDAGRAAQSGQGQIQRTVQSLLGQGGQQRTQGGQIDPARRVPVGTVDHAACGVAPAGSVGGGQRKTQAVLHTDRARDVCPLDAGGGQKSRRELRIGQHGHAVACCSQHSAQAGGVTACRGCNIEPVAPCGQVPGGFQGGGHVQVPVNGHAADHGQIAGAQAESVAVPGQALGAGSRTGGRIVARESAALLQVIQVQWPGQGGGQSGQASRERAREVAARGVQFPAAAQSDPRAAEVAGAPGAPEFPVEIEGQRSRWRVGRSLPTGQVSCQALCIQPRRACQFKWPHLAAADGSPQVGRLAGQGYPGPHAAHLGIQDRVQRLRLQVEAAACRATQRSAAQRQRVVGIDLGGQRERLPSQRAPRLCRSGSSERPTPGDGLIPCQRRPDAEGQVVGLSGTVAVFGQQGVFHLGISKGHTRHLTRPPRIRLHAHGTPAACRNAQIQIARASRAQCLCQPSHGGVGVGSHRPVLRFQVYAAHGIHGAVPSASAQAQIDVVPPVGGCSVHARHSHELGPRHAQGGVSHLQITPQRAVVQHVAPGDAARRHPRPVVVQDPCVGVQIDAENVACCALRHLHVGIEFALGGSAPDGQRTSRPLLYAEGSVRNIHALAVHIHAGIFDVQPAQHHLPAAARASLAALQQFP